MQSGVKEWLGVEGPAFLEGLFSDVGIIKIVPVICSPRRCFRIAESESFPRAGQGRGVV